MQNQNSFNPDLIHRTDTSVNNLRQIPKIAIRLSDFTYETSRLMLLVYGITSQVRALRVPA